MKTGSQAENYGSSSLWNSMPLTGFLFPFPSFPIWSLRAMEGHVVFLKRFLMFGVEFPQGHFFLAICQCLFLE